MAMEPRTKTVSHPAKSFGKKLVGMPLMIAPSITLIVDAILRIGNGISKSVLCEDAFILVRVGYFNGDRLLGFVSHF